MIALVSLLLFLLLCLLLNLKDKVFGLWLGGSCWEDMAGVELSGGQGDEMEMGGGRDGTELGAG